MAAFHAAARQLKCRATVEMGPFTEYLSARLNGGFVPLSRHSQESDQSRLFGEAVLRGWNFDPTIANDRSASQTGHLTKRLR